VNELALKTHCEEWLITSNKCLTDPILKVATFEVIKRDPIYFFDKYLWTYDPRTKYKVLPFRLYPFQIDFIKMLEECYVNKEHILVEKSRDMGFSWLVIGFILWKMIAVKSFSAGIGSRKALLVDELGNMKSLMQRLRFMINYLPSFLAQDYNEGKHSKTGLIKMPSTDSTCTGEAGDDIGRGDRTSLYLIDEFAHIPRSSTVQEAISQTSDFIIYGSTPKGKGNEFARLRWKTNIKRFTMHWKNHPEKNEAWYQKQKEFLTDAQIAQELDISYDKSTEGRVYKWFDMELHASKEQKFEKNQPVFATFDWGIGDPTCCIMFQYYAGIMRIINYFEHKDKTIDETFVILQSKLGAYGLNISDLGAIYGDPDGRNRNIITGDSVKDFIKSRYGFTLRFKLPNVIANRIMSVMRLGKANRVLVDKDLSHLIDCFLNYRYPDKEHGVNEKPLHDWTSHAMSAMEYYADYEHGMDQFNKAKTITTTRIR